MNICQGLIEGSRLFPEAPAVIAGERTYTYGETEELSGRAATLLREAGAAPGERVALLLGNVAAFPVWYYACLRLGGIAVSVNTRLAGEEIDFILSDCEAKVLVTTADAEPGRLAFGGTVIEVSEDSDEAGSAPLREADRDAPGSYLELEPSAPGVILYTSGTTGFPKGATLSHANVRATVHAFNHLCGMTEGDRLLVSVPLFHCYGQNALLNAGLEAGASVVLQRKFDLRESVELIRRHRVTKLFGVPATFQLMLEACVPEDLVSVEYCFSAAATLAPQVGERWHERFGMPIYEGYGLTETAPFASYNHRLRHRPGCVGTPVDLVEMKIVDPETGRDCAPGETGEIAVRGPNVMLGYWNRPEETATAIRDGWFHSGDAGLIDEQGYFHIVDRIKDMVAVGGLKVFPVEVERVLFDDPAVADCAVVGGPHETWGEEVVAFVVAGASSEPDAEALRARCLARLAAYKVPSRFHFVEELPRNPAGKVLKTVLRERLADEGEDRAKSGGATAEPALLARLRQTHPSERERLLVEHLRSEIQSLTGAAARPGVETPMLETGMDSMMMVSLATRLQESLGPEIDLPATLVFDHPRIRDMAGYLLAATGLGGGAPENAAEAAKPPPAETRIEEMSEAEAEAALLKELED